MTRSERKLLITTSVLGALLTVLVASMDAAGFLDQFEEYSYDLRAQHCQFFQPPPTDRLVHIDIDDASLEAIGAWPWPRTLMAEIVEELRIADTKALAFDVIYSEPQETRYEPVSQFAPGAATRPAPGNDKLVLTRPVNDDEIFADALRRFGRAIVPVSLNLAQQSTPPAIYRQMVDELGKNPGLTRTELAERIGSADPSKTLSRIQTSFSDARKEALYDRISRAIGEHPDPVDLRRYILPASKQGVRGDVERVFDEQLLRQRAVQALRRFGRTIPGNLPPLVTTRDERATVETLSRAAKSTGFVDYIPLSDGTVRCVPLWANHRDFMFPQMGLSLACAMLGTEIRDIQIEPNRIIIPKIDGSTIEIPVYEKQLPRGRFGMFMDIPWFGDHGSDTWQTMYDYKNYKQPRQHMPIVYIHDAISMRQRIRANNERLRDALIFVWSQLDASETRARQISEAPWQPDDPDAFTKLAEQTLAKLRKDETIEYWKKMKPEDLDEELRAIREKMLTMPASIQEFVTRAGPLKNDLQRRRDDLHKQLGGKAALIGWIAVGAIADYVPTSMHPRCPGVVVHGVIFNSIMTNNFWRRAPYWITFLLILLMGGAATAIVARLTPWQSIVTCTILGIGYILFNGLYLFDYKNLIVGLTGPIVCSLTVWAGCTAGRYIQETQERARIKRFFQSYVDPKLVDYALEYGMAALDGQEKEISVVFTDLQGFTTISERLKEKAIPILNQYMSLMIPIVRRHDGYLNKLLGDGIMYFFNAPRDRASHARDAIASALEMQAVMPEFNRGLEARGLPPLLVRAGISSGLVIVGNAGTADRSSNDYTALGDEVNLGSRLEGANKAFGTHVLVNDRARVLAGDEFLYRPVGVIQVVGKTQGVAAFEAMAHMSKATDEQKRLAEMTAAMVQAFVRADFAGAMELIEASDARFGTTKLTKLYAALCRRYLETPPEHFTGDISLSEK